MIEDENTTPAPLLADMKPDEIGASVAKLVLERYNALGRALGIRPIRTVTIAARQPQSGDYGDFPPQFIPSTQPPATKADLDAALEAMTTGGCVLPIGVRLESLPPPGFRLAQLVAGLLRFAQMGASIPLGATEGTEALSGADALALVAVLFGYRFEGIGTPAGLRPRSPLGVVLLAAAARIRIERGAPVSNAMVTALCGA